MLLSVPCVLFPVPPSVLHSSSAADGNSARRDFLCYALSLMRCHNNEHADSLPVIDVSAQRHVAYVFDALVYYMRTTPDGDSADAKDGVVSVVSWHDGDNDNTEEQDDDDDEVVNVLSAELESLDGDNADVAGRKHPFFQRSDSTMFLGCPPQDPFQTPLTEALPLADQPHLLQPNALRVDLFGVSRRRAVVPGQGGEAGSGSSAAGHPPISLSLSTQLNELHDNLSGAAYRRLRSRLSTAHPTARSDSVLCPVAPPYFTRAASRLPGMPVPSSAPQCSAMNLSLSALAGMERTVESLEFGVSGEPDLDNFLGVQQPAFQGAVLSSDTQLVPDGSTCAQSPSAMSRRLPGCEFVRPVAFRLTSTSDADRLFPPLEPCQTSVIMHTASPIPASVPQSVALTGESCRLIVTLLFGVCLFVFVGTWHCVALHFALCCHGQRRALASIVLKWNHRSLWLF